MNMLFIQVTCPSRGCGPMTNGPHPVRRSQQFAVGCDGMREVVNVIELIRPRRAKWVSCSAIPYPNLQKRI
jgi:hypothetical protein